MRTQRFVDVVDVDDDRVELADDADRLLGDAEQLGHVGGRRRRPRREVVYADGQHALREQQQRLGARDQLAKQRLHTAQIHTPQMELGHILTR